MTKPVVVMGAGGHAKVCIEILRETRPVAACIGNAHGGSDCLGVPVIEGDEQLSAFRLQGIAHAFVAIGSNSVRARMGAFVAEQGFELVNAVSSSAVVSPSVRLGAGVAVMAGAVINAATDIADLVVINTGATVDHDCVLGRAVHIAPQCALAGSVTVGDGSMLGVGAIVLPGVRIGANVVVGAGAVVREDVPDGATVVGVPARARS